MRLPDPTEMATRALVAVCVAIAVLQVAAEVIRAAGPILVPLIAVVCVAALTWRITFRD